MKIKNKSALTIAILIPIAIGVISAFFLAEICHYIIQ